MLLSDGGDTVENQKGGDAREAAQLKAAVTALTRGKVRAEVVAFKSAESNGAVLQKFATAGGGSVATAGNRAAVAAAFDDAARTLESQVAFTVRRPAGLTGVQTIEVKGVASGSPFTATAPPRPGRRGTGRGVDRRRVGRARPVRREQRLHPPDDEGLRACSCRSPSWPCSSGVFLLVLVAFAPVFRSQRKERISTIEAYGLGRARPEAKAAKASPSAISQSLVDMGEQFMSGRESTSRTMALLDRADLPWRAGEWFVLRMLAVLVGGLGGLRPAPDRNPLVGLVIGVVAGLVLPAVILRYLAKRRANKFEFVLPDVLMLTATSLASGFSLLQALDAVARDAPEPCAKEFSRALAETRIGADVSDALEHMADRMDSNNMRWATMAIRIQREVGGNLAETLRTTAATLRGAREPADVAPEVLSLAERRGRGAQRLGQVAADLALDADRHRGPAHVVAVHALGHVLEGVRHVGTDPGLGQGPRELLGARLGGVARHGVERLEQAEAAGEAGGRQHEDVGEQGLELAGPAPGEVPQDDGGQDETGDDADDEPDQRVPGQEQDVADEPADEHGEDPQDEPLARTPRQVGPVEQHHRPAGRLAARHELLAHVDQALADRAGRRLGGRGLGAGTAQAVGLDRRDPLLALRAEGRREGGEHEEEDPAEQRQRQTAGRRPRVRRRRRGARHRGAGDGTGAADSSSVDATTGASAPRSRGAVAVNGEPDAMPLTSMGWTPVRPAGRRTVKETCDSACGRRRRTPLRPRPGCRPWRRSRHRRWRTSGAPRRWTPRS